MRGTKLVAVLAALAVACLAGLALADKDRDDKDRDTGKDETKTLSDREFVQQASAGSLAEINAGNLAARKGATPGVREFGARLARDHARLGQQLNMVADRLGIVPARTADKHHQEMLQKLAALNGAAFDHSFLDSQIKEHEKDIKGVEQFSKHGKSEQLRTLASKAVPIMREHLKIAKDLRDKSKESASR